MKTVKSQLRVLIASKELRDNRTLAIRTVAKEADVSVSTVQGLLNNTMRRVPLDDLAKLCTYLKCDIGDVLKLEEVSNV